MNTKEKIIEEARQLFAVRGYTAVSIRDIGKKVGIKESSIYNHFKNKQDIFDTIIQNCVQEMMNYFTSVNVPAHRADTVHMYDGLSFDRLYEKICGTFRFYFENEHNRLLRNILLLSRFENEACKDLYLRLYLDEPMAIQSKVFAHLIDEGVMRDSDPKMMALEFYGPVFIMIEMYEHFSEIEALLREHLYQFMQHYCVEGLL